MAKGRAAFINGFVKQAMGKFEDDRKTWISRYHAYGRTIKTKLFREDEPDRYIHVYYTASGAALSRESDAFFFVRFIEFATADLCNIMNFRQILLHQPAGAQRTNPLFHAVSAPKRTLPITMNTAFYSLCQAPRKKIWIFDAPRIFFHFKSKNQNKIPSKSKRI